MDLIVLMTCLEKIAIRYDYDPHNHQIELDGVVTGGKSVFTNLAPSCFHTEELKEATKNNKVYTDRQEFVHVRIITYFKPI